MCRVAPIYSHNQVTKARQTVTANYPDPILENPNGWRVGAKANATMIVASSAGDVKLFNNAVANSKLAPAIALAGTNSLTSGSTLSITQADATGRPGLQYGVVLSKADQQMVNTSECGLFLYVYAAASCLVCLCALSASSSCIHLPAVSCLLPWLPVSRSVLSLPLHKQ